MSGIPDNPTRRQPEKPGEFPNKSVNGHERPERDKTTKPDDSKPKKSDDKQKPDPKH